MQQPVLAHLRDVYGETAAIFLLHGQLKQLLGLARRGPKPVDDLVTLLDLDESPSGVVARAPD